MNDSKKLNDWKIPLYKIYTDDEDVDVITKIIKRGSKWAIGPEIEEFENALKKIIDVDYCLTLNSGTSALHSTLLAYNINQKNELWENLILFQLCRFRRESHFHCPQ